MLKGYNMLFYFAGSMIMHEPSEECIGDFWERGILRNLPVSSSNLNFVMAASQLRESYDDKITFGKRLHDDFIRLFSSDGLEQPLAPAYESEYEKVMSDNSGFHSASVTEFYHSYGWKSKYAGKINDDHLGTELLFLTLLIDKFLLMDDEACRDELSKEIRRYINHHILSWVPEWNKRMQMHANTLSFKGIGNLIQACSEDIFVYFGQKSTTSVSTNTIKN